MRENVIFEQRWNEARQNTCPGGTTQFLNTLLQHPWLGQTSFSLSRREENQNFELFIDVVEAMLKFSLYEND